MKIPVFELPKGDQRYASVSFSAAASRVGSSVSSATWEVESGDCVSISGAPTLSANVAQALLVASDAQTGCALIKIKAEMADGQTITEYIHIKVVSPTC